MNKKIDPHYIQLLEFRDDFIRIRITEDYKMYDLKLTAEQFLECVKSNEWAKPFVTTYNFGPMRL